MHDACVALMNGAVIRARVRRTMLRMGPTVDDAGKVSFECTVNDRRVIVGNPFDVAATFRALLRAMLKAPAAPPTKQQSGVRAAVRPRESTGSLEAEGEDESEAPPHPALAARRR